MAAPGAMYWPRLTLRRPSTPANGARMVFCAISARWASTCACAVAAAVTRLCTSSSETSFSLPSCCQRCACTLASLAEVSSALSVACSLAVFRRTSTVPAETCWPGFERDRTDHATRFGGDVGAVDRDEGADRFAVIAPALHLRDRGTDRHRRLRHVVEEVVGLFGEERLDREHPAEHDDDPGQHQHPAQGGIRRALRGRFRHGGLCYCGMLLNRLVQYSAPESEWDAIVTDGRVCPAASNEKAPQLALRGLGSRGGWRGSVPRPRGVTWPWTRPWSPFPLRPGPGRWPSRTGPWPARRWLRWS